MAARKIVVIGSNCFTGSHIVDGLLESPDNEVVGVSRAPEYKELYLPYRRRRSSNFRFQRIDLVTEFPALVSLLDDFKPAVVIHVAALSEVALSHERPIEYFETNTVGTVKLCHHLRKAGTLRRYLHISSAEIFGACSGPVTEETPFNPSTPYAVSKAAADMYLNTLIKNFSFPATLIRSTNVYGRHQQLFKIIPRTIINLKLGKPIELHGGGTAAKSFIHVRDVVKGLLLAMDKGTPGAYHFSVTSGQTVADVVRLVCSMMGRDFAASVRVVGERLGQDARYALDCAKAGRELGWSPDVPFEQGVRETIDWIEANWREIAAEPHAYVHRVSRVPHAR